MVRPLSRPFASVVTEIALPVSAAALPEAARPVTTVNDPAADAAPYAAVVPAAWNLDGTTTGLGSLMPPLPPRRPAHPARQRPIEVSSHADVRGIALPRSGCVPSPSPGSRFGTLFCVELSRCDSLPRRFAGAG